MLESLLILSALIGAISLILCLLGLIGRAFFGKDF